MAIRADGRIIGAISGGCVESEESLRLPANVPPRFLHFETGDERAWEVGLPGAGSIDVLVERLNVQHAQPLREKFLANERAVAVTVTRSP